MSASLLELVRGLLERTYDMRSGLDDLGPYLIGDEGYRRLYADGAEIRVAGEGVRLDMRDVPKYIEHLRP